MQILVCSHTSTSYVNSIAKMLIMMGGKNLFDKNIKIRFSNLFTLKKIYFIYILLRIIHPNAASLSIVVFLYNCKEK